MFNRVVFVFLILFWALAAKASITDTIIAIDQIVAKGVKFDNYSIGAKVFAVDSFQLAMNQMNSVAELLNQYSSVNVTLYGPGGLGGVKMRGGGADHTSIIWNGINLKPPMSGEMNYSAINSGVFNQIRIQPGGSSTLYGTGTATGVIFLSNDLDLRKNGFNVFASAEGGSFDSYAASIKTGYNTQNFGTLIGLTYQESENNYEYKYGKDTIQQEHSAYNTLSLVQQNKIRIGTSSELETDFWYTNHFKKIPSSITQSEPGKTEQTDENIHFALNFSHYGYKWFVKYRAGFLMYNNMYLGFDRDYYSAKNLSYSYINEVESKYQLAKTHSLFLGINSTIDKAESSSYEGEKGQRDQLSVFGRYTGTFFQNKLGFNADVRASFVDEVSIPLVYSLGISYEIIPGLSVKCLGSKLYSLPDLNDLYWNESAWASGNKNLTPEYGWSAESGIHHKYSNSNIQLDHEITFYTMELTDAIVWLPDTTNKWVPNNVDKSFTQGVEFNGSVGIKIAKSQLRFAYDYALTDAKLNDSTTIEGAYVQRPYVPKYKAGFNLKYQVYGFSIAPYIQYVSKRYFNDVSFPLDAYYLCDLYFNYSFDLGKVGINAYTKFKNIFNTEYQIMTGYPMPGQSMYIGVNIKF